MEKQIARAGCVFGCDPELFFSSKGKIVGSENVIPEKMSAVDSLGNPFIHGGSVVQDGVQVELNPAPDGCRETLGAHLVQSFLALKKHLATQDGVKACFNSVVTVPKGEFDKLSAKSKEFGCAPSFNHYDSKAHVVANAAEYRKRAAGGHIHLGLYGEVKSQRKRLIPIMDAVVGNTCILIDRDKGAVERRKNYGRAGEFRLPAHGIEYRTLSNFWLRSYPLYHFVMGLARLSVSILSTSVLPDNNPQKWDAEGELLEKLDLKQVQEAINTNDLQLAMKNYRIVRAFIAKHVGATTAFRAQTGLDAGNLQEFDYFCRVVQKKGLQHFFPEDPLEHWCKLIIPGNGWENFSAKVLTPGLAKEKGAKR